MRLPLLKTFHLPCTALAATVHQNVHLHFLLFSVSGSLQNFDRNVTGKAGALQFCGAESFLCARNVQSLFIRLTFSNVTKLIRPLIKTVAL